MPPQVADYKELSLVNFSLKTMTIFSLKLEDHSLEVSMDFFLSLLT